MTDLGEIGFSQRAAPTIASRLLSGPMALRMLGASGTNSVLFLVEQLVIASVAMEVTR